MSVPLLAWFQTALSTYPWCCPTCWHLPWRQDDRLPQPLVVFVFGRLQHPPPRKYFPSLWEGREESPAVPPIVFRSQAPSRKTLSGKQRERERERKGQTLHAASPPPSVVSTAAINHMYAQHPQLREKRQVSSARNYLQMLGIQSQEVKHGKKRKIV